VSKVATIADTIALVTSGSTVGIGGSPTTRKPVALIRELAASNTSDLHVVSFTGSIGIDLLVGSGSVASVASGYMGLAHFGRAPNFVAAVEGGTIEDREYSEWLLLQRIRTAAMGLPFMPTRAAVGSQIADLHSFAGVTDPYSGDLVVALPPLEIDVTLLHAWRASASGYVQFAEPPDHLWDVDVAMARASATVIVSVDELVDDSVIAANPHLTQLFPVDLSAVAPTENGAWPTASRPTHGEDAEALRHYAREGALP
jgi:glutaconate CoA-transferase subunit A